MLEKDLDIYDIWESPNGNLFIKISENYSIAIGGKYNHEPNETDLKRTQYVKSSDIVEVKQVSKLIFDN